MVTANILDKELNNFNNSQLDLSILFLKNGLSYYIYSIELQKFLVLKSFEFSDSKNYLEEVYECLSFMFENDNYYSNVKFIVADPKQIIIPEPIFDKNNLDKYWNLNFDYSCENLLYSYYLSKSKSYLVFAINKNLDKFITTYQGKKTIIPSSASFIDFNIKRNRLAENPEINRLYVQVYDNYSEFLLIHNHNLLLYNTVVYKTQNDLLYHIINVFEQLKISQFETEVILSGFIETDSLVAINLKKFITTVYFESQNLEYKYFYKFQDLSPHYYFYFLNYA